MKFSIIFRRIKRNKKILIKNRIQSFVTCLSKKKGVISLIFISFFWGERISLQRERKKQERGRRREGEKVRKEKRERERERREKEKREPLFYEQDFFLDQK